VSSTSAPTPPQLPGTPGGLGRRVAAIALDWLVATGIAVLFDGPGMLTSNQVSFTPLLVFFVEVTTLTWLLSASFGQRILRLRVVRLDGSPLGLWRSALRTLLICLVIPAVVMDTHGRGLQDRAVGSMVVRAD